jgi:hypothetical protein
VTYSVQVRSGRRGVSHAWRRSVGAVLVVTLAVFLGGGGALADPGDVAFRRLSGFPGDDWWSGVSAYGSSVYVGGDRNEAGVLRRYSRSGDVIWTRTINIKGASTVAVHGVAADASGVYVAGDYGDDHDVRHAFVARYQPNATALWVETLDLGADSVNRGSFAVAIDTFGSDIYVAGQSYQSDDHSDMTTFVQKLDHDAGVIWTRRVPFEADSYLKYVDPTGVAASADGVYLVGTGYVGGDDTRVVFLRTYDTDGHHPRTNTHPISDFAGAAAVAADGGGAYVVAQAEVYDAHPPSYSPYGSFLLKFDSTASLLWQRRITARSNTEAMAVSLAPSGVWITGIAASRLTNQPGTSADAHGDAFLVRYSRSGDPRLTYQYSQPGRQFGRAIWADDVGIYIAGLASRFGSAIASGSIDGLLLSAELP